MNRNRGIAVLLLILAILILAFWHSGTIVSNTGAGRSPNIKLGLDLAGGVSITYQAVKPNPSEEEMSDTIYKLQQRVQLYSTEAQVYKEGTNRINVAIPGVSDANAILEELGRPGSLTFQTEDGTTVLTGIDIADAQPGVYDDNIGRRTFMVQLAMTPEGATKFAQVTAENVGRSIAIVFDGQVISNPRVNHAITGGEAQISPMESFEAAEALASQIRIGSLSLELEELHSKVVGPQLGADALAGSIRAAIIGMILVIIFMIAWYRIPGLAASIALLLYCPLFIYTIWAFEITLTLPGIAGIVLSIGMAVDANVIIFARVREEIATGKPVDAATKLGFQKALSAILDSEITTLIAAFVLALRGSGPVKGFAYTLAIGVVLSMFTALVVTRWIMKSFYVIGLRDAKYYGTQPERRTFDFLTRRWLFIGIALAVIAAGFVGMGVHKAYDREILNYSLEFVGGSSTIVAFHEDLSIEEISQQVVPVVEGITGDGNVQTQKIDGSTEVVIKTRSLDLAEREAFNRAMEENFGVPEDDIISETISSTVSAEMRSDAIWAVVIALLCMLLYIWFRFRDIRFAGAAVIGLLNDVLWVLAFYVISWTAVGTTFIAAMLAVVGFSLNATIVIFDRIREHLAATKNQSPKVLKGIANRSITQTLSRTFNTSITTFFMLFMLWLLGVTSIKEFAAPLMVGILAGAFSSVFLTVGIWYMFRTGFVRNINEKM